jgi:osmoprotectant transport system substrate-binding protein
MDDAASYRSLRLRKRSGWAPAVLASLWLALSGCEAAGPEPRSTTALDDEAITVASFDFAESELLAEIYAQGLEANGFDVERSFRAGPRELVQPALARGLVELVPEYSGTALQFASLNESDPVRGVDETHAALERALDGTNIRALESAAAQDRNAIVVTRDTSEHYGLTKISDLADVAPELTFGGPPECPVRPFCLKGLEEVYGLKFGDFLPLDAGGPLTHQALDNGHIDVALLFTTDPRLSTPELVVLADDRGLQPADSVTPLLRREVIERWGPKVEEVINEISRQMTTSELRSLNEQTAEGVDPATVAQTWLQELEP